MMNRRFATLALSNSLGRYVIKFILRGLVFRAYESPRLLGTEVGSNISGSVAICPGLASGFTSEPAVQFSGEPCPCRPY